ncbi:MAG TPA: outer membrane protein assembly factor BamE [Stellaceae bacterium]|nr:outer membrane protein assembly factor BamE [Stellaceae bacterium]
MHSKTLFFLALVAGTAAACQTDVNLHGNLPSHDEIAQIRPGKTTKTEVTQILGSPSSVGVFDPNHWYYISKRTKRIAFFDPKVLDQEVYVVEFNQDGVVKAVEHKGMKDAENISPAPGETPAPGRHLTFMEQLIGNMGRFNTTPSGNPP